MKVACRYFSATAELGLAQAFGGTRMLSLLLMSLLAASGTEPASVMEAPRTTASCTAARLRSFARPTGVPAKWPVSKQLPANLSNTLGLLLSDQANFEDGYSQWLLVDENAVTAYVVQRGGFVGGQTVYGPLPVASCSQEPE